MDGYLLTPPDDEPVTLAQGLLAARVDGAEFSEIVPGLIAAARGMAEHETGRKLVTQVWRVELPTWPASADRFKLSPATAVALRYWDGAAFTSLASDQAVLITDGYAAGVLPPHGVTWPAIADHVGPGVQLDFTVGYGAADTVPETIKLWIKAQVAYWVRNPEAASEKTLTASPFLARLLDPHRTWA